MGRFPQEAGNKGSLKWIQRFVNGCPDLLNDKIIRQTGISRSTTFEWRSPLVSDEYAEYRDKAFLDLLELNLQRRPLDYFWPA